MSRPNQTKQSFPERPEMLGSHNTFDLSHNWISTFRMGLLVPFLTVETLPGDKFYLKSEVLMRFAPLYLPIMHQVNLSVDYFYIPNRILWPGVSQDSWEFFVISEDSVDQPYVKVNNLDPAGNGFVSTLMEYMGFPTNESAGLTATVVDFINCFPLSAYLKLWDEYYRNDQVEGQRWFPLQSGDNAAAFDAALPRNNNTYSGNWLCLRRNWNRDYFTSCTPTPQIGNDVLIPLVNEDFVSPISGSEYKGPYRWRKLSDDAGASGALAATAAGGDPGRTLAGTENVYLDIMETAGTIRQLRFAVQLTEFLERAMRAGDRYRDHLKKFWDADPDPLMVDRPKWLGGKKGRVVVSEVMSNAQTESALAPGEIAAVIGQYAGQAIAQDSVRGIEYYCREHGFIIGIISVYPKSSYFQGISKMWTRRNKYDYAWEQFALIGDQEVKNKEILFTFSGSAPALAWNEETFGYNPRYSEYRYMNDIVAGQMRNQFLSFHLGRLFADSTGVPTEPLLNEEFLQCAPRTTDVFVTDPDNVEDEIYAWIFNDVQVSRRLPKYGIPKT